MLPWMLLRGFYEIGKGSEFGKTISESTGKKNNQLGKIKVRSYNYGDKLL